MNPHMQRGLMLFEQSRYELAEKELRRSLGEAPNHAYAHALLAMCLSENKKYQEATAEAETAIGLEPDEAFNHSALSHVLFDRHRYKEAESAIHEALDLDPYESHYFAQLASILFAQSKWQASLDAADEGLAIDPEDRGCVNIRAMALVRLGRKTEAGEAMGTALEQNPEDSLTHANRGWTLIEQGKYEESMHHFRESLRLDPTQDWARQGIVHALKAKHFLYRIVLRYFLWMKNLSGRAQWGVIIGAYVGFRVLRSVADKYPEWSPWITPILILYGVFVVMTWIAQPMFNLLLRVNRFGRLALSREEVITSNWVGICVCCGLVFIVLFFVLQTKVALGTAIVFFLLIPPLANIYHCDAGWPRTTLFSITLGLAVLGLSSSALLWGGIWSDSVPLVNLGLTGLLAFVISAVITMLLTNGLVMATVKK